MEPITLTFTHKCTASQNLLRLATAMEAEGRNIQVENTESDYCVTYIDGHEFTCDWKHNNFDQWGSTLADMGYRIDACSRSELVFTIEKPKSYMTMMFVTDEKHRRAQEMFAPLKSKEPA